MIVFDCGVLLASKVFSESERILKQFVNMAIPLHDTVSGVFSSLLTSFCIMLVLNIASSTGTVSESTTFPTMYDEMGQFPSTMLPDGGIHRSSSLNDEQSGLSTIPSSDEVVQWLVSSSNSSNATESTSTPEPIEERIELTPIYPSHRHRHRSPFNNAVISRTTCTNSSVDVHLKFSRPFRGFAYSKKNFFRNTSCNFLALPSSNVTEVALTLPFESCGNKMRQLDSGVLVYNTILIQQHQMILTRFDKVLNVSCLVANASIEDLRSSEAAEDTDVDVTPIRLRGRKAIAWLELVIGSDLYEDEESQPPNFIESALYMVIKVADSRKHYDMVVRNCIAHDRRLITNDANMYQLYDFYGCPSNSSVLEEFVVTNKSGEYFDLMSYSRIKNFTLFAQGQLFITCGINLCSESCNPKCDRPESERYGVFSRIVMKKMVRRGHGATTPSTLHLHSDDSEPRIKRSVSDVFSNAYHASKSFLTDLFKDEFPTLESTEISAEARTFPKDSDLIKPTASAETTLSTDLKTIVGTEALNNVQSIEVLNESTEMHKQPMVGSLKSTSEHKIREVSSHVSPDVFPSEIFVSAVFILMVGSYLCLVHSRTHAANRVASFK